MRKLKALEIVLVLFFVIDLMIVWTTKFSIAEAQIPTVINGLVTSISMIIGFSGAIMVFILSKRWDTFTAFGIRPMLYLILIAFPIGLLWSVYYWFIVLGSPDVALRVALTDLAFASIVLGDFIAFYTRESVIQMRENTIKMIQDIQKQQKHEEKKIE